MSSPKAGEAKVSRHDELPGKKFQPASASFSDPKSLVTFIFGPGDKTTELIVHKEVACHQPKVQLWVLADLLAMPKLQNAVIDALQNVAEESDLRIENLRSCCFRYIYKNSMNESQLRKYILAPFVRRTVDPDTIKDDAKAYPHAMLVDVSEMYISMNVKKDGLEDMNATEFYVDVHDA
ncbi:uncharacterized protein RSE6_02831 [Rhynchosporium secalis]|uniref:BTB domain-containing protein n=1 Tax=Rhynchosporium secalis TaxID=38038 RepID=A0A1E1M192_RHYSE|nr:uncharacterized protein RSE6_02831 [Rhynchosporium secalis]